MCKLYQYYCSMCPQPHTTEHRMSWCIIKFHHEFDQERSVTCNVDDAAIPAPLVSQPILRSCASEPSTQNRSESKEPMMARMLEPLTIPERVMLLQTLARCEIVYQTYMPEELGTARVRKAFSDLHARLTAIIKVATILREHPDMSAATIKLPGAEGEAHIPPSERVAKMVTLLANVEVSHAQGEVLQRIRGPCPQPISEWYSWYSRKPPAITLGNAIGALFSRS